MDFDIDFSELPNDLPIVTSVSGGKTSAFIADNYPFDHLVFSLVRTNDKELEFKDKAIKKIVEDKIQAEFIGTLEYDDIVYTMLDLEQRLGVEINWVTGVTFDELITKRKMLPNAMRRFCTTEMKMFPIAQWWYKKFNGSPVYMNIGYRANELNRANRMKNALVDGFSEIKIPIGTHANGNKKWKTFKWRKPIFPLVDDLVYQIDVLNHWQGKNVRFAKFNNCVGCFNARVPRLLEQWDNAPKKMEWFSKKEKEMKAYWRKETTYEKIRDMPRTGDLFANIDTSGCDSGFCGM